MVHLYAQPHFGSAVSGGTSQQQPCWEVLSGQPCQQLMSNFAFYLALGGFLFVDAWISELEA